MKFNFKNAIRNVSRLTNENLPLIFECLSIGLSVASTVSAIVVAPKAHDILKKYENDNAEDLEKQNAVVQTVSKVCVVGKYYILPIGLEAASIFFNVKQYKLNITKIAALTSGIAMLTQKDSELNNKIKDILGEEQYNEIKQKELDDEAETLAKDIAEGRLSDVIERANRYNGNTIAKDLKTGRIFFADRVTIERMFTDLKGKIAVNKDQTCGNIDDSLCINDLYDCAGLETYPGSPLYTDIGFWSSDYGYYGPFPTFSSILTGDTQVIVFDYDAQYIGAKRW